MTTQEVQSLFEQDPELKASMAKWPVPKASATQGPPNTKAPRMDGPIQSFHSYFDPAGTTTTCGQAAIAALADFWELEIDGLPRDANDHWDNDTVVNKIIADGYGPDVMLGAWGTSGGRIVDGVTHYGSQFADCGYAGLSVTSDSCWQNVQSWVNAGYPVPVLVSANAIWSDQPAVAGHWPIIVNIADGVVYLANCNRDDSLFALSVEAFLSAWNYLLGPAYGYNYCYVICNAQGQG
jgi:hypothetical protein